MQLYKTFSAEQYAAALESWRWLGLNGKTPVFTSLFGSVFFEAADGIWYLDTVDGTLTRSWADRDQATAALSTREGQDRYLMAGLVYTAQQRGLMLEPHQVYDLQHPPAMGGSLEVDNLEPMDFATAVGIAGQLHEQIKDLPPGAEIQIQFDE